VSSWSLPDVVFKFLAPRVRGKTVLEFGSGAGSARLASLCQTLLSVEHDLKFVEDYPKDGGTVFYAPIDPDTGWYRRSAVEVALGVTRIDAIVVDGPTGAIGRSGLLQHLDIVPDVPILFDDTHRPAERELALSYWRKRQTGEFSLHALPDGRGFTTIGWGWA